MNAQQRGRVISALDTFRIELPSWGFTSSNDTSIVKDQSDRHGIRAGSINPNLFQDQEYKFGSSYA